MSTDTCLFPPQLNDKQLLDYLDERNVHQEIAHHLENCPFCRDRAQALERFQKTLSTRLYRATCPSPMELGEFHLRMLGASQMLVIGQHLRGCPHCAREVSQLEEFLSSPAPETGLLGTAKVLIARLMGAQAENSLTPVAPALRGEAKGPLTFEVDGILIVLDIQPSNAETSTILGQVAADDQDQWTGALVELRKDGQLECSTTIDDLGAFQCEGMLAGKQELRIVPSGGSPVVVTNLEL